MKSAFKLFKKNILLNILVIIQIACSAVFGIIACGVFSREYLYYNLTDTIEENYVYIPEDKNIYYKDSAISKYVKSGDIIISHCRNERIWGMDAKISHPMTSYANSPYKIDNVFTVNKNLYDIYKKQLKKGGMFNENCNIDQFIECVIVGDLKKFPLNSYIDGAEFSMEKISGEDKLEFSIKNKYKFKIVGYLGEDCEIADFMSVAYPAESLDFDCIFKKISYKKPNLFEKQDEIKKNTKNDKPSVTIICASDAIYKTLEESGGKEAFGDNSIFAFKEGTSEIKKDEIIKALKDEAGVTALANLREKEKISAKNTVYRYLPIMICFISMVIVGVICTSLLTMINNKSVFKTYIICGMNKKQGLKIVFCFMLIIFFSAILLTLLNMILLSALNMLTSYVLIIDAPSIIFACADFIISGLLIFVSSGLLLKKYFREMMSND